jgi:hypothetical protein
MDTFVTPVQATSPADPFSDPFGDRHATRASALQLQPPNTPNPNAPGLNQNSPPFNPGATNQNPAPAPNLPRPNLPGPNNPPPFSPLPAPSSPFAPPVRPFSPEVPPVVPMPTPPTPMPMNPDVAPTPPNETPMPMPESSGERSRLFNNPTPSQNIPCPERTYGDQNCCKSDITCRNFIQGLMQDKLSKISLDITPRFKPNELDPNEEAAQRENQMKLAGVRDWYRRGVTYEQRGADNKFTRGSLENLTNGRAIIKEEESGEIRTIPLHDLSEDDLCFISGHWNLPPECAIVSNKRVDLYDRGWMPSTMTWTASALCHKPLYFEQVQHERYGHTAGPFKQPWIDGVHFFGSAIMLPYSMALDPPWECEYVLGYYRPGSCAPWQIPPFPFSPRAALSQAGFVVGGIYVIP